MTADRAELEQNQFDEENRETRRRLRKRTLPFARPDIGREEIEAVNRVLSGGWLTAGPETQKFEQEFAEFVGARNALAVNSCTAALHLGMLAWDIRETDAVLLPAITFTATAEIVTYSGALPLILDVDREDYLLSPEVVRGFIDRECDFQDGRLIHRASNRRVRAMIPVHLGGRPCDMDGLRAIAREYNLRVLEDAAHAFPTRYHSLDEETGKERVQTVGTIGDITAFSFYATKNLTTGEGGMLTTEDDELAERLRRVRVHGIQGQTYGRKRWKYDVVDQGYKYNMTDMAAAIGRVQLARTKELQAGRARVDAAYRKGLSDLPGLRLNPETRHESSHHLFTLEVLDESGISRDRFVEELYARGIAVSLHFIPLYRLSWYRRKYKLNRRDFPASEDIYARMLSLPIYASMSEQDVEDVVLAVREVIKTS